MLLPLLDEELLEEGSENFVEVLRLWLDLVLDEVDLEGVFLFELVDLLLELVELFLVEVVCLLAEVGRSELLPIVSVVLVGPLLVLLVAGRVYMFRLDEVERLLCVSVLLERSEVVFKPDLLARVLVGEFTIPLLFVALVFLLGFALLSDLSFVTRGPVTLPAVLELVDPLLLEPKYPFVLSLEVFLPPLYQLLLL